MSTVLTDVLSAAALAVSDEAVVEPATQPVLPMVLLGAVMVATFAAIAFNVLHKTVAALFGAVVCVVLALALGVYEDDYGAVHHFIEHDLSVIGVIVGTSILVEIASHSGLFHFIAVKLVKLSGGSPARLLPAVMTATFGFVTFLTIAPGTLIMASLVLVISKALDEDPKPYMLGVIFAANSGALVTFASGIPTLMIGTSAGIPYVHFLIVSAPLAFLSVLVAYGALRLMYRRHLTPAADAAERAARVAQFDEWALVHDRSLFHRSAAILGLTILGFALAQQIGVGLDFIAVAGGTAALLFSGFDPDEAVKRVKWPVILFFVGLFVIVGTVRETGLLEVVAGQIHGLSGDSALVAMLVLIPFAFFLSGAVDNIPVAATMISIVRSMIAKGLAPEPLWWSLIAACNLGGNLTPVASIASVIALHALEKERGTSVGWGEYLRVGGALTVAQILLVMGYLAALERLGLFPALP